jgi:hypothetical protein
MAPGSTVTNKLIWPVNFINPIQWWRGEASSITARTSLRTTAMRARTIIAAPRPVVYTYAMLFGFSTPAPSSKGYRRGLLDRTTSMPQAEYVTDYAERKKIGREKLTEPEIPYQLV